MNNHEILEFIREPFARQFGVDVQPERPLDPPEPKPLDQEAAEEILRMEYSPLQIASALNEDSYYGPAIHKAVKVNDATEIGRLILKLYNDHIQACADELVRGAS